MSEYVGKPDIDTFNGNHSGGFTCSFGGCDFSIGLWQTDDGCRMTVGHDQICAFRRQVARISHDEFCGLCFEACGGEWSIEQISLALRVWREMY